MDYLNDIEQAWKLVTNIEKSDKNNLSNTDVLAAIKALRIVFEEAENIEITKIAEKLNATETKVKIILFLAKLADEEIQDLLIYTKK